MLSSNTSAANGAANYIEDVFSTWLYTGNGSTQTITNGIDLAGKGGLVWVKNRTAAYDHILGDTVRGASVFLRSNTTDPQSSTANHFSSFNSNGFSIGSNANVNLSSNNYASWTFRKQPKFFDVVTWTGTGANRTIAHNLGSVPGCIMVKRTDTTGAWQVYHQSLGNTQYMVLNTTAAATTGATRWNSTTPTDTVFSLGTDATVNANGGTYVAYLFAHDAGGFGLTGTDNVISCGSYTGTGAAGNAITLGYEPQWIMIKASSTTSNWFMYDTMRGWNNSSAEDKYLWAQSSIAEGDAEAGFPTATGFQAATNVNDVGVTYIYIAIRRGPMKVPTTGTKVFALATRNGGSGADRFIPSAGTSFPTDLLWALGSNQQNGSPVNPRYSVSRLTDTYSLELNTTAAEAFGPGNPIATIAGQQNTVKIGPAGNINGNSTGTYVDYFVGRASGFMDVVCYTGTGSARTVAHNLAAVPELMIVKSRSTVNSWPVWNPDVFAIDNGYITLLNSTIAVSNSGTSFNSTAPTSAVFTVGTNANTNGSGVTYVAYLFSSCPGVSKVGSYTGTGTTQQINCGFTGGARFVLIKRIASAGGAPAGADWYVWDSARGIVAGNDPYLLLNSTAAEVTSTDYVDTYSAGFEISSTAPAEINASGGTFIFLAIA